jgi:hypothetical protein
MGVERLLKLLLLVTLAQVTATGIMVLLPMLYSDAHRGEEAWPVLLPGLAGSLVAET